MIEKFFKNIKNKTHLRYLLDFAGFLSKHGAKLVEQKISEERVKSRERSKKIAFQ